MLKALTIISEIIGLEKQQDVCIVSTLIKSSFVDSLEGAEDYVDEGPRTHILPLSGSVCSELLEGDLLKIVMYTKNPPKTVDDLVGWEPDSVRLEVKFEGNDAWDLVMDGLSGEKHPK